MDWFLKFDDEYHTIPPRREIALVGLNDNINEAFLLQLCRLIFLIFQLNCVFFRKLPSSSTTTKVNVSNGFHPIDSQNSSTGVEPFQLTIYRHPTNGRHLGFALIDFPSRKDSEVFFNLIFLL